MDDLTRLLAAGDALDAAACEAAAALRWATTAADREAAYRALRAAIATYRKTALPMERARHEEAA